MNAKRIAILGAGISGLSAAYFLQKMRPDLECVLFDKDERVGGVIQSSRQDGVFFEHGPRTFSTTRTPYLLRLIKELGLEEELHFSHANIRYILHEGAVRPLPEGPFSLFFSPFRKGVFSALMKDLRHPPGLIPDESVESFILRHGNRHVLEQVIDPMILGIFAGDYKKLSVGACLPKWKMLEYKYGSVIKGLYKTHTKNPLPPLYTLKNGMHSLPEKLSSTLTCEKRLGTEIASIEELHDHVRINGEGFDHAMVCLPSNKLTSLSPAKYIPFFQEIEHVTLSVVSLAFEKATIPKDGFGYLAPSKEHAEILGVIFDSSVFPELHAKDVTRISVMLKGEEHLEKRAFDAIKHHLKIRETPIQLRTYTYPQYLPQLFVGHLGRRDHLASKYLSFIGNYLHSVSVESCITEAEKAAKAI